MDALYAPNFIFFMTLAKVPQTVICHKSPSIVFLGLYKQTGQVHCSILLFKWTRSSSPSPEARPRPCCLLLKHLYISGLSCALMTLLTLHKHAKEVWAPLGRAGRRGFLGVNINPDDKTSKRRRLCTVHPIHPKSGGLGWMGCKLSALGGTTSLL